MEVRSISIKKLHPNTGQIKDVPKNPRFIRDERFEKLKKSIEDDPEMLELRELGVYEYKPGEYVVLLGNMRLRAMQELGYSECMCKVIPADTDAKKLRAYTIKDNVGFGQDDWDIIANEWDSQELSDWGMENLYGAGSDDVDGLFDDDNTNKEKEAKIEVIIPKDLEDAMDEIRETIRENLRSYAGISIK